MLTPAVLCAVALAMLGSASPKTATPALRQTMVIPLPGVEKRIDHLAVDPIGHRLFVAGLGNGSLEVVDLPRGVRLRSIAGLSEPQGIAYLPALHKVVVANGGGTVMAFDDTSFRPLTTLGGLDDADNLRFDVATKLLYLGYGNGALGIIDPAAMKRLGDIQLPAHPESFRVEASGTHIFVNVPVTKEILVVDREKRQIVSHIALEHVAKNYPMFLDDAHHRLYVGTRQPARVVVFDTRTEKRIADFACVGDTDDLFYDAERDRLYVIGGEGFLDVFDTRDGARYARMDRIATSPGSRTGLWSQELNTLFIASPQRGGHEAAVHVFDARPQP